MELYWIWLTRLEGVGPVTQRALLSCFRSPEAIFTAKKDELASIPKLSKNATRSILTDRCLKEAETILKKAKDKDIGLLPSTSPLYPEFAREIPSSPTLLYYRGTLRPLQSTVGVVGSRRCTPYGRKIAEEIGAELAHYNIPLISGFARGIDSYAQSSCTTHGGYTISILGCGVDRCYPPEQKPLQDKILDHGGLFLSAYPPGTPPLARQFIARNQIISAWSTELILVEAGERSGALSTANFSLKNNKPIYAVPHPIDNRAGLGTNTLLSKGVPPFLSINTLQAMKNKRKDNPTLQSTLNSSKSTLTEHPTNLSTHSENTKSTAILQHLRHSPATIEQLSRKLHLPANSLEELLFELELNRKIIIRGNLVFAK